MDLYFAWVSVNRTFFIFRRQKKTEKYPLKLRVTFNWEVEYYPTNFDLSQEDHRKLTASRVSEELQKIRSQLQEIESKARNFAREADPFTFEEFERHFIKNNKYFWQRRVKRQPFLVNGYQFDIRPYEKRVPLLDEVHPDKETFIKKYSSPAKRRNMFTRQAYPCWCLINPECSLYFILHLPSVAGIVRRMHGFYANQIIFINQSRLLLF